MSTESTKHHAAPVVNARGPKKRMLIIVNPYATTVSDRLKNLVVYALQGRFEVEAIDTEAPEHAIEIGREARDGHYDVVVAFGGDGTLNEVANGLAGTDIPVAVLPGGSTNVVCRTLGIPNDVIEATEHLLGCADDFRPRRIDLGLIDERHFVFSAGAGIDATVVERVDANPKLKATAGPWYYSWAAISGYYRRYLRNAVRMHVEVDGATAEGITVLAQNSDPFTYFSKRPVRVCPDVAIDDGHLGLAVLERAAQRDVATLIPRLLGSEQGAAGHRRVRHFPKIREALISSASVDSNGQVRPLPLQVDGDYIGERPQAHIRVAPGALTILA
jgi:diacylglycerol kinase family enzyme